MKTNDTERKLRLSALLKKAGYKITPSRLAILSVLEKTKYPLTVERLTEKLTKEKIDQATVYRNVEMLKTIGVVRQIDFEKGHAYYEITDTHDHHHIACIQCDRVSDVHGCNYANISRDILKQAPEFSTVVKHSLEFFGICKTCTKKH